MAAYVRFTNIAAFRLPDADPEAGEGSSDPYIKFIVHCDKQTYAGRTETIENSARNAKWKDDVEIAIPVDLALEPTPRHACAAHQRHLWSECQGVFPPALEQ